MGYSTVFIVLLCGYKVASFSYPLISNQRLTVITQEELIKRRVHTLQSLATVSQPVNPRIQYWPLPSLAYPTYPKLELPEVTTLTVPRLPEVRPVTVPRLPEVRPVTVPRLLPDVNRNVKYLELPMLKPLPAILTVGEKKETKITPPRIGAASSSLQDLLNAAISRNKPQLQTTDYSREEVWNHFKGLQDRASQYLIK